MGYNFSAKEQELIDSFRKIIQEAQFPLEMRVRQMDWPKTKARPYGVGVEFLVNEPLEGKPREVLLACAAQWRQQHWPDKTVEEVDELGFYITVHQPVKVEITERFTKK